VSKNGKIQYGTTTSFSALTLLDGCQKEHPAYDNWVMRCWCGYLSGAKVEMICIWSSWCHCHPIISCFIKIANALPFWCWLT